MWGSTWAVREKGTGTFFQAVSWQWRTEREHRDAAAPATGTGRVGLYEAWTVLMSVCCRDVAHSQSLTNQPPQGLWLGLWDTTSLSLCHTSLPHVITEHPCGGGEFVVPGNIRHAALPFLDPLTSCSQ